MQILKFNIKMYKNFKNHKFMNTIDVIWLNKSRKRKPVSYRVKYRLIHRTSMGHA